MLRCLGNIGTDIMWISINKDRLLPEIFQRSQAFTDERNYVVVVVVLFSEKQINQIKSDQSCNNNRTNKMVDAVEDDG